MIDVVGQVADVGDQGIASLGSTTAVPGSLSQDELSRTRDADGRFA